MIKTVLVTNKVLEVQSFATLLELEVDDIVELEVVPGTEAASSSYRLRRESPPHTSVLSPTQV